MNKFLRAAALMLLVLLLAPAECVGALGLRASAEEIDAQGDPFFALADGETLEFVYTPPVNSEYALCFFGGEGAGEILENGATIASGAGSGLLCSAWLVGGTAYTMRVSGDGYAEVARNTRSRCFAQALEARENVPAGKVIARAWDVHWYRFTAQEDGRMMLTCVPRTENLTVGAMLFDANGARIACFDALEGGSCLLRARTQAGESYFIRVCAPQGQTGDYDLNLYRSGGETMAEILEFDAAQYALSAGNTLRLEERLRGGALLWVSDAPQIARVDDAGVVYGLRPGEATITAHGMGAQASCRVRVAQMPLRAVNILAERIELAVGDDADVQVEFAPSDASDRRLRYSMADPGVASVSPEGVVKGLQEGETVLTVVSLDGGFADTVSIVVRPAVPKYRALLVGEAHYPFALKSERKGSESSVEAIRALLESARFDAATYAVRTEKDLSRAELIAAIRQSFRDATAQDTSLLYITCHGSYDGGMSFMELSDGSSLSARDLERELREIPGTIVLMIDCCGSGGAIGRASMRAAFARGITGAFAGAAVRGSKYKVIASAGMDEDSHRVAFNENASAGTMATVFARALCDAAGWNMDAGALGTMGADANFDGCITMDELAQYMRVRVNHYMNAASRLTGESYHQSIQAVPEGDPFILYQRKR